MAVDVIAEVQALIQSIFSSPDAALQYATDPNGVLAAQGITDGDLSQLDMYELVDSCAAEAGLPESTRQLFQSYNGGGGGGGAAASSSSAASSSAASSSAASQQTAQDVVQHLNYVTYQTYEGDEHITQQLINQENYDYSTNIDNSVDVDVDGEVHGDVDIDIDATNQNATGDGAQIIDGDNYGQANTGDGAVQVEGDLNAPVNTGEFTGVQAEDVDADNSVFNFGDGDVTNFGEADIDDSAVSVGGGDATNVSDNALYEGSAISTGGDASGNYEDTDVEAYNSNVATEQGAGNLDQHADVEPAADEEMGVEAVG